MVDGLSDEETIVFVQSREEGEYFNWALELLPRAHKSMLDMVLRDQA